MKTIKLILIFCVCVTFNKTTAQTLYSETKTFQENGYVYQWDKAEYGIVTLYNKANQFTYAQYENKDGSPLGNTDYLPPLADRDNWTWAKSIDIVNNAFSPEEKQRVKGEKIDVSMTVDTSTGRVIEVDFAFFYNSAFATIPISTYRKIEEELKNQIWFTPTETGKKLKFFKTGWMHTVE